MTERRVAVVTGATSGIGQWIALGLARAGMHTVLVARAAGRGEATRAWIAGQSPGASTELVIADLSLLAEAQAAAARIAAAHPCLAVLVNNAGVFTERRRVTAEGHEMTLAVNHLAPFVLTRGLVDALRAGAPARVVNVGSAASDRVRLDLSDLEATRHWRPQRAYGRSKLAIMVATFGWAERLAGSGVTANVVHPGVVATRIAQVPGLIGIAWRLMKPFLISPERGADTPLYVALAPELADVNGRYFKQRAEATPNPMAREAAVQSRLWSETERLCGGA